MSVNVTDTSDVRLKPPGNLCSTYRTRAILEDFLPKQFNLELRVVITPDTDLCDMVTVTYVCLLRSTPAVHSFPISHSGLPTSLVGFLHMTIPFWRHEEESGFHRGCLSAASVHQKVLKVTPRSSLR